MRSLLALIQNDASPGSKYEHVLSLVESKNPPASISPDDECETDYGELATHVFNTTRDLTYSDTELYDDDSKITEIKCS